MQPVVVALFILLSISRSLALFQGTHCLVTHVLVMWRWNGVTYCIRHKTATFHTSDTAGSVKWNWYHSIVNTVLLWLAVCFQLIKLIHAGDVLCWHLVPHTIQHTEIDYYVFFIPWVLFCPAIAPNVLVIVMIFLQFLVIPGRVYIHTYLYVCTTVYIQHIYIHTVHA